MQNSNLGNKLEYLPPYHEKQKEKRKTILLVASVIAGLGLLGLVCFLIAKNGFSVESLLSTILAIFSIVISILFYFKADSTSSKFYESSYNFMKEQSMLLGRIEERFGAKFDNITTTLEHMSLKTSEIVEKESEKGTLIKEFEKKSHISNEDKEEFLKALKLKEIEISNLRKELDESLEKSRFNYEFKFDNKNSYSAMKLFENTLPFITQVLEYLSKDELKIMLNTMRFDKNALPPRIMDELWNKQIVNTLGDIYPVLRPPIREMITKILSQEKAISKHES